MADKNLNPMNQKVYDVSDNDSPLNYNQMLHQISNRYGQTPDSVTDIMNRIAYHEAGPSMDPSVSQIGGGPGRGLFQFETGADAGGMTAMRRLRQYFADSGEEAPSWTEFNPDEGVDASRLTPEQQKMLFMANVRYHPTASLEGITPENLGESFWAPSHWAGADKDKDARLRSFNESMAAYNLNNTPTPEEMAFNY